jgi:metal-sulfur cluster biosynthetic enzyme
MSNQSEELAELQVMTALREVIEPQLGINVADLGPVYSAEVRERKVRVAMTTAPACRSRSAIRRS